MHKPIFSLIAAIGKNRELGANNKLLWHIPEDTKYFRETIKGHVTIMGRKTFESMLTYTKRPMDCTMNMVVTRDELYRYDHKKVMICHSLKEAVIKSKILERDEVFITGGTELYKQSMSSAKRLYLTVVDAEFAEADTFFPEYNVFNTVISKKKSSNGKYNYTYYVLEKKQKS